MNISKAMVDKLSRDYRERFGGNPDIYFGWLYLSKKYDLPVEELIDNMSFVPNETGIDAYYLDIKQKYLYLYQFKWSNDCSAFIDSLTHFKDEGMGYIFGRQQNYHESKFTKKLLAEILPRTGVINRVILCLVYNGDVAEAENSQIIRSLCEDLESKKYMIDDMFGGREVSFTIQFSSNETRDVREIVQNVTTYRYTIDFTSSLQVKNKNGELLHVGLIKMMDLLAMYREMKYRLFDKNIRFGLSPDNAPNKSIRKSLANIVAGKETAESFAFNHNGITLYAEKIDVQFGRAEIVEPRILNGAQTITVFQHFFDENISVADLKKAGGELNHVKVICKIISQAEPDFVTNVTICTNKQNPVEPWNLRASDFIQLQFDDKFRKELGIFYERQENAFDMLQESGLENTGVVQDKAIQIRKLAQTFLAVQGDVDKISRISDIFEQDTLYHNTFRNSFLKTDSRLILLCYKIQYRLPSIIKEIQERGQNKYAYLNRARNLIWALLAQGILNDPKLDSLIETYGTSITMETEYADYLKDLASRRVRPIISEVTEQAVYFNNMQNNNFAFLKTKAVYIKSMEIAANRFGWKKIGL